MLTETRATALAEMFKTLSDPTRIRLLSEIADGERCVHELTEALGSEQSAISHQLRRLKERNLVRATKRGRHVYYALVDEHVKEIFEVGLEHVSHGRRTRKK